WACVVRRTTKVKSTPRSREAPRSAFSQTRPPSWGEHIVLSPALVEAYQASTPHPATGAKELPLILCFPRTRFGAEGSCERIQSRFPSLEVILQPISSQLQGAL